ncbi:MAG: glycosyltransferase family 8 protein [Xanthobacteraceae bacterium]
MSSLDQANPGTLRLVSAIDRNYVVPWSAMIASLRDHNQDVPADVFILQYDLTPDDIAYIERVAVATGVRVNIVQISPYPFALFHTRRRRNYLSTRSSMSPIAYVKAFVDRLLPANLDRIVTIDADIIVSGRMDELLTMNLSRPVAAVANITRDHYHQFNSGFMLVDLREWRKRRISEVAYNFLLAHSDALHTHDQQVLNLIFGDEWLRLHPKWNYMEDYYRLRDRASAYSQDEIDAAHRSPIVIHYKNSGDKPWHRNSVHPRAGLYGRYVDAMRPHRAGLALFDPADPST